MSCCRGKRRGASRPQVTECKTMEQVGSSFLLWPLATGNGVRVTVQTTRNGYVELGSFLQAYPCEGGVARLLLRYVPDIQKLASTSPSALLPHSRSGISVADLVRLAAPPKRRSPRHGKTPAT